MVNVLLNNAISKLKNGTYKLDESIKPMDLVGIVFRRMICMIRGAIRKQGMKKCGKMLFVGKAVTLRNKNSLILGSGVTLGDYVELEALSRNGIVIGNDVKLGNYTIVRCTGNLKQIGKGVCIGDHSGFGDFCFFGASGGIRIGNNVIAGQNVRFHSSNHNFDRVDIPIKDQGVTSKGIEVDDDCWIGSGAVFLDGVKVGRGCVIGANSLVNKNIPPYSVAVGNPVRVLKSRKSI